MTAIQYTPPPDADPRQLASKLDVMVVPEGQPVASGLPVISFTLQQSAESQTFAIPGDAQGHGLWLGIAGSENGKPVVVGNFRILREHLAP